MKTCFREKPLILVVEDNEGVKREFEERLNIKSDNNFYIFSNDGIEIYMTGNFKTAKELIEREEFDAYFLDNQILLDNNEKGLFQNDIVELIVNRYGPKKIFNISSHENENKYITGRCEKSGYSILEKIDELI